MARALWIALVLASAPAFVHADDKPWVAGVSDESKAAAKILLDAGNARFIEHDYTGALDRYKAAVAKWDHPAIRFNMAVEASESLKLALKFGAAPLEEGAT